LRIIFQAGEKIRHLFLFILLADMAAVSSAFEIRLNGQSLPIPSERDLQNLSYSISTEGRLEKGISLGELVPPLVDAWRLEAAGKVWMDEDLADRLAETYLSRTVGDGWALLYRGERISGIERIEIQGDRAAERDLEVWLSWEGVPELKAEIERWAKGTGVKVRCVDVPDTRSKLLAAVRGGGRIPDLVMVQSDNLPSLLSSQVLQNLDRMDVVHLVEKGRGAFESGGRRWAAPFYFDAQLAFYSRKLLPTAPPLDWSTDYLEAEARRIARSGATPLAWNAYSAYWLLSFALGFGKPTIEDADGLVRPDDPGTRDALKWILGMRDLGLLEVLERDAMVGRFAAGRTAIILSGSYSIPEFERIGLDFGVAPYPIVSATNKPIAPLLDFKGFAMTRSTRSPVTARRLLEYLSGVGVQQRFCSALYKLPANRDAWEVARTTNRFYPQLDRSYEIGAVIPPSKGYAVYKNTMWKILRFIYSGSMTVDEALSEAQRLIEANQE